MPPLSIQMDSTERQNRHDCGLICVVFIVIASAATKIPDDNSKSKRYKKKKMKSDTGIVYVRSACVLFVCNSIK